MKKEKMLRAMSLADEKFVAEADPTKIKKKKANRKWIAIGTIAACICVLLTAVNLWLFLPFNTTPPDISVYTDSPYYPIIQKLKNVTYEKPTYDNNFEQYFSDVLDGKGATNDYDSAPSAGNSNYGYFDVESQQYEEVTDNQVEGVIEADRIKRSDQYIYYLYDDTLRIYSIEGEDSEEVGAYSLTNEKGSDYVNKSNWAFYLSADCKTVIVVTDDYSKKRVEVRSLDVSDPAAITEKNKLTVTGTLNTSRVTDGTLLLLTDFYVEMNPDFSDVSSFIPQIKTKDSTVSVLTEKIICPEKLDYARYTVVHKLDESTLAVEDSMAFLSYSEDVYVSEDMVYATRADSGITEISGVYYAGEGLAYQGSVSVDGKVKDQYSMDVYNGILRVVTTTYGNAGTSASLYCVDLTDWQVKAKVEEFAPIGETVRSVRFDKNVAYVCTAVEQTDPVFFFDLSDLNNITYKDTGTIQGFSTSLIQLGNGYLLGIGQGANSANVKLEVYEETQDGVTSVCKYVIENAMYSTDYKSYYINREAQLIGLGFTVYDNHPYYSEDELERYMLLSFNGKELERVLNVPLKGECAYKRAVYIDGYFYMFGENAFQVEKIA